LTKVWDKVVAEQGVEAVKRATALLTRAMAVSASEEGARACAGIVGFDSSSLTRLHSKEKEDHTKLLADQKASMLKEQEARRVRLTSQVSSAALDEDDDSDADNADADPDEVGASGGGGGGLFDEHGNLREVGSDPLTVGDGANSTRKTKQDETQSKEKVGNRFSVWGRGGRNKGAGAGDNAGNAKALKSKAKADAKAKAKAAKAAMKAKKAKAKAGSSTPAEVSGNEPTDEVVVEDGVDDSSAKLDYDKEEEEEDNVTSLSLPCSMRVLRSRYEEAMQQAVLEVERMVRVGMNTL
jgi:hypothetical protein